MADKTGGKELGKDKPKRGGHKEYLKLNHKSFVSIFSSLSIPPALNIFHRRKDQCI